MKFFKLLIIICFLSFGRSFATDQTPDFLIIENDTISLVSNPLEKYFKSHPRQKKESYIVSTNLWRGYLAFFKIIDNKLVVENIYEEQQVKDSDKIQFVSIYKEVFGEKLNFECDFYTGILVGYSGKIIERMNPRFGDIYEKYKLNEITNGKSNRSLDLNHNEFIRYKVEYFKIYKETETYKLLYDQQYKSFMKYEDSYFSKKKKLTVKEKEKLVKKSAEDFIFYFLFSELNI